MFGSIGGALGIGGPLHNSIGGESFIRHIGNDKLIFDFHEGSGTTVHDKSHNNNNGIFGAGAAAPTWRRNSVYFDGGDYVDLTGINHGISTGGLTFCFNLSNYTADSFIFDQETGRRYIHFKNSKLYVSDVSAVITGTQSMTVPIMVQISKNDSDEVVCYINGLFQGIVLSDSLDYTYDGTSGISLGSRHGFVSAFITATMYSFRILNKGLSGIECQQEYLANKFSN